MKEKRKISVRKILQVGLTIIVSAGCIMAIVSASRIDNNQTVKSVVVHIKNDKKYHFIEQKEIMDLAINNRNIDVAHTPLSKLDIHTMEKLIMADPWVSDAQVFVDNAHVLHMYVTQRVPVVHIFQTNSQSYYMDTTLSIMPLSASYIYYAPVVTNVPELKNDSTGWAMRKQIVSLVRTIQADTFWNAQISEIIVDSDASFELLPVLGNQTILFGDATRMNEKLNNLFVFYKNVLNRIGWDKYETLDVRFKGQVVASPSLPYKGPVDKAVVTMNWINSIVETEAKNDTKDSLHVADVKTKVAAVAPAPVHLKTVPAKAIKKTVLLPNKKKMIPIAAKKSGKSVDKKKIINQHNTKQKKPKYILPEKK